ncbi:hypothetical protein K505DRAFT_342123 [Melanomma pulvis-pyrius CBS 109.77]|uniref:Protein kinase domain-containing protein n=1 Tax=Melanomma pulvis-pyrius CBS 109.77 TaxID=1314802 RepID=A0A6A6WWD1_9PLEO|nr:hypothetical protein K505DRAFT_342123 [Melanomma pulvis-pyrius CBS 109.77]
MEYLDKECKREADILESILHTIQLIGSYTWKQRFHFLFYPIANCNLKEFMDWERSVRDITWETQMKEAFRCLAGAVASLHPKRVAINHKNIKSSNILFLQGSPILADFDLSNSFKGRENGFSVSATGKSVLYAALEVVAETQRGTS